uniref:Protein quiver n=1 Tax=Ascaris lumbricoides TaxID=6252 RepID=A0A0M3HS08_ASCLU
MQRDFLNRKRGPQKRIAQPKMFDNFCDLDVWIIKQRSSIDCDGACFKWQQIVNNSGSFSYMTLRSCYSSMFDLDDSATTAEPRESYCSSTSMALECLAEANVLEHSCWCQGDYCNGALMILPSLFSNFALFYLPLVFR